MLYRTDLMPWQKKGPIAAEMLCKLLCAQKLLATLSLQLMHQTTQQCVSDDSPLTLSEAADQ